MENEAILEILKAGGGNIDIQTYKVGTGGLTRVNIQPVHRVDYANCEIDTSAWSVFIGFISGLMVAGVGVAILAIAIMGAVAVAHDGTSNSGVPDSLIATCFYVWVVVTLLGGVAGGWYNSPAANS